MAFVPVGAGATLSGPAALAFLQHQMHQLQHMASQEPTGIRRLVGRHQPSSFPISSPSNASSSSSSSVSTVLSTTYVPLGLLALETQPPPVPFSSLAHVSIGASVPPQPGPSTVPASPAAAASSAQPETGSYVLSGTAQDAVDDTPSGDFNAVPSPSSSSSVTPFAAVSRSVSASLSASRSSRKLSPKKKGKHAEDTSSISAWDHEHEQDHGSQTEEEELSAVMSTQKASKPAKHLLSSRHKEQKRVEPKKQSVADSNTSSGDATIPSPSSQQSGKSSTNVTRPPSGKNTHRERPPSAEEIRTARRLSVSLQKQLATINALEDVLLVQVSVFVILMFASLSVPSRMACFQLWSQNVARTYLEAVSFHYF